MRINQTKLEDFIQGSLKHFLVYFRGRTCEYCRGGVNYPRAVTNQDRCLEGRAFLGCLCCRNKGFV